MYDSGAVNPGFREQHHGEQPVDASEGRGQVTRSGISQTAGDAGQRRSHDEGQAEAGPDESHHLGAPMGRGPIGERRLCHVDRGPGGAGDEARQQEQSERVGPGKQQVGKGTPDEPDENDGAAPDSVAHPAPPRRQQELHQGVARHQHADGEIASAVPRAVAR